MLSVPDITHENTIYRLFLTLGIWACPCFCIVLLVFPTVLHSRMLLHSLMHCKRFFFLPKSLFSICFLFVFLLFILESNSIVLKFGNNILVLHTFNVTWKPCKKIVNNTQHKFAQTLQAGWSNYPSVNINIRPHTQNDEHIVCVCMMSNDQFSNLISNLFGEQSLWIYVWIN